jgi:hypothetical protein
MKIYVTLMPGAIWTPLLLIQPVHGYNELTLTSSIPLYDDGVELERPDENKVSNAILDGLPLLRSKGILFIEAVVK